MGNNWSYVIRLLSATPPPFPLPPYPLSLLIHIRLTTAHLFLGIFMDLRHMPFEIFYPRYPFLITCHRSFACWNRTKVLLGSVMAVIDMTIELSFCRMPSGTWGVWTLEGLGVVFEMVIIWRNWRKRLIAWRPCTLNTACAYSLRWRRRGTVRRILLCLWDFPKQSSVTSGKS